MITGCLDMIGTYFPWQVLLFARYNSIDETIEVVETGIGGKQEEDLPGEIVLVVIPILKKFYLCLEVLLSAVSKCSSYFT